MQAAAGTSAFRPHAARQAGFCTALGAPFTALLCRLLGERIDPASALGERLDSWAGDPNADALVLRLTGGLHAAVLAGTAPGLAALYPPASMPDPKALWAAMAPVLDAPGFMHWLNSAPQTNEVGRTGALAPGLLVIAAETGLPLALLELGASAGLNLLPDRYALRLGNLLAGDAASPLEIAPAWEGADPPDVALMVASRAGVDLNPLAVADPADAARMLAYVWPDQPRRLANMRAAIAIAATDPPPLTRGDAAAFVEQQARPRPGVATVVFHSIAYQYFPAATRQRIAGHMARAGAAATPDAPLAWLRYEMHDPANPGAPELRLRLWPGGDDRLLAVGHPHGASLRWLA
jgi:hypothetical protein